jgi:hypothetical protein
MYVMYVEFMFLRLRVIDTRRNDKRSLHTEEVLIDEK